MSGSSLKSALPSQAPPPPQSRASDVQSKAAPAKPAPRAEPLLDGIAQDRASASGASRAVQKSIASQRATGTASLDKGDGPKSAEQLQQTRPHQASHTQQSAPVLYNQATTTLNRGRIAEACGMFESLVRTHRDNPRRPDALLGWARCEMARGAFGRAETVLRTLIKDHPDWRKSGETWLAEIQRQRQLAVLRAQRSAQEARRARKAAPQKASPQPPTSAPASE